MNFLPLSVYLCVCVKIVSKFQYRYIIHNRFKLIYGNQRIFDKDFRPRLEKSELIIHFNSRQIKKSHLVIALRLHFETTLRRRNELRRHVGFASETSQPVAQFRLSLPLSKTVEYCFRFIVLLVPSVSLIIFSLQKFNVCKATDFHTGLYVRAYVLLKFTSQKTQSITLYLSCFFQFSQIPQIQIYLVQLLLYLFSSILLINIFLSIYIIVNIIIHIFKYIYM